MKRKVAQAQIIDAADRIEVIYSDIRTLAKKNIPDFHFLDYEVSLYWRCKKSPLGMCVFILDTKGRKTKCRYCNLPTERK